MLEAYAKATAGQLFQLATAILDTGSGTAISEAAGHAGIAYAVTGLMRALPWHAATGQVYLPKDLLDRHGALVEAVQAGIASPALRGALAELRGLVRRHLENIRGKSGREGRERRGLPAGEPLRGLFTADGEARL